MSQLKVSKNEIRTKLDEIKKFHQIYVSQIDLNENYSKQCCFHLSQGGGYILRGITSYRVLINPTQQKIYFMRGNSKGEVETYISTDLQFSRNFCVANLTNKDGKEIKLSITYNM